MRLLFVTGSFPYPPTSSRFRDLSFIRQLSTRHEIRLISLVSEEREDYLEALAEFCAVESVRVEGCRRPLPFRTIDWMLYLLLRRPPWPWQRILRERIERRLQSDIFDIVHGSGYLVGPALIGIKGPPVVFDLCDASSLRLATSCRYLKGAARVNRRMQALRMRFWERQFVNKLDGVIVASDRDLRALGVSGKVGVVPNGVDHEYFDRRTLANSQRNAGLLFVGAMDYAPNVDAVVYFVKCIFPQIRASVPHSEFWIVGRDPTEEVVRLGSVQGVHVTGYVPDIRPFLEDAAVFVAPLRFASGIQNKVLEAMAMRVPVVTTSEVAAGLEVRDGQDLLIRDNSGAFAQAVISLLVSPGRGEQLCTSARRLVLSRYSWTSSAAQLEGIYSSVRQ